MFWGYALFCYDTVSKDNLKYVSCLECASSLRWFFGEKALEISYSIWVIVKMKNS